MCGRYTLKTSVDVLAEWFSIEEYPSSLAPSYNIAPTQEVAAIVEEDEKRKLEVFRWGLIPSWAKDPAIGNRMINPGLRRFRRNRLSEVLLRREGASS